MTKKRVTDATYMLMEANMKEILEMIYQMVMEVLSIQMGFNTRDSGKMD